MSSKTKPTLAVAAALFIIAFLILVQCDNQTTQVPEPIEPEFSPTQLQLTEADNAFGLELFRRLSADDPGSAGDPAENIFISPFSVATALAMAANGAEGNTKTEMYETLGFGSLTREAVNESFKKLIAYLSEADQTVMVEIANSIWSNKNYQIKQSFIETNQTYYEAEVASLDFSDEEAAEIINGWVQDKTHDLIDGIVDDPLDPELIMVLLNAVYFKGDWTYQFEDSLTRASSFYAQDGSVGSIELMNGQFAYNYLYSSELQAVELPYGSDRYSMLVLLPGYKASLDQFVDQLTPERIAAILSEMKVDTVTLGLPKFKLEYEKGLIEMLKLMGMEDAFDPYAADFSGIRDQRDLMISKIKHKAFVEVNEAGTEAAAVTSVEFGPTSIDPFQMIITRPFVFVIREKLSGTIMFIGKVNELGD